MSVSAQRIVRVRNYQGLPNDWRGPTGDFLCALQATGNVSGGTIELTAIAPATIASKYVWHLHSYGVNATPAPGASVDVRLQQAGGESEFVDQAIVPSVQWFLLGSGVLSSGSLQNSHVPSVLFPVTEVRNGLTLTWVITLGANVNATVYNAWVWGHVFQRQIFRNGGPEHLF